MKHFVISYSPAAALVDLIIIKTKWLNQQVYLSCDERAARVNRGCDEADELALVLTVDLAVEVCQPVAVGLQSSQCLRMSVTKTQQIQI